MGEQRDAQRDKVARSAQALKGCPVRCGKGLATLRANEAPVLARMKWGATRACRQSVKPSILGQTPAFLAVQRYIDLVVLLYKSRA